MERIQNKFAWALVAALSLLVIAALAGVVRGGPLDPPGPPGSTQENLIFQPADCNGFPIVISSPGSYKLAQSITLPGGCSKDGIQVNVASVTIDLQGFELVGLPFPAATTGAGIEGGAGGNLTVRNGTIRNWRQHSIDASGPGLVVDHVQAIGGGGGIRAGNQASISNCRVADTPDSINGLEVLDRSTIINCRIVNNNQTGIRAGADTIITETVAANNGDDEILAGAGAILENCTADGLGTAGEGIEVGANSVVRGCTARNNGGVEILAGAGSTLEDCIADGAGTPGNGIEVATDSIVRGCTARNNGQAEITAGDGSLIEDCVADGWNGSLAGPGQGILVYFDSVVRGCVARYNQGSGIRVEGWRNRIEDNLAITNQNYGIIVVGAFKNVGVGNNAADNVGGDYSIDTSGDNKFHPWFPLGNAPIGAWDNFDQ